MICLQPPMIMCIELAVRVAQELEGMRLVLLCRIRKKRFGQLNALFVRLFLLQNSPSFLSFLQQDLADHSTQNLIQKKEIRVAVPEILQVMCTDIVVLRSEDK